MSKLCKVVQLDNYRVDENPVAIYARCDQLMRTIIAITTDPRATMEQVYYMEQLKLLRNHLVNRWLEALRKDHAQNERTKTAGSVGA